jgi:hypothetical protein
MEKEQSNLSSTSLQWSNVVDGNISKNYLIKLHAYARFGEKNTAYNYSCRAPFLVHDTIFPKVWNNPIDKSIY